MVYRAVILGLVLQGAFILSSNGSTGSIQGDVLGAEGRPLSGAEVRIERKDKQSAAITAKTDARGKYAANGVSAGVYKISLVMNGAVKSAVKVKTTGDNARVDFDLKPSSGTKIKHYVWMDDNTGSHLGGRWVQVDDTQTSVAGSYNVDRMSGEYTRELMRRQTNNNSH